MKGSLASLVIVHFGRALSEEELRTHVNTRMLRDYSDVCTVLQRAIIRDDMLAVEALLRDYGADPNLCDEAGYPPLLYGHGCAVRLLHRYGANVNVTWDTRLENVVTPLQYAWRWEQTYFIDLLDLGAQYSGGVIPLPEPNAVYIKDSQRERNALYLRAVIARERRAQRACFALLLCVRVFPRDLLRAVARALWSTRRREGWEK